jgi:hypothetical protein
MISSRPAPQNRLASGELADSIRAAPSCVDKDRDLAKEDEQKRDRIHKGQKKKVKKARY